MEALTGLIKEADDGKIADYTIILGFLSEISNVFTKGGDFESPEVKTFTDAIASFIYEEKTGICQKIKDLPPNRLKELNGEEIINVIRAYFDQCVKTDMSKEEFSTKSHLKLLIAFLKSQFLDKKVQAVNEMKNMFDKKNRTREIQAALLTQWLSEFEVIEYIYTEAKHVELITRSAELLNIFAIQNKLDSKTIDMIWENCITNNKHESITGATLDVLKTIARNLEQSLIENLLDKVEKLPLNMLGEYVVQVKDFYLNILYNYSKTHGESRAKSALADKIKLEILWVAIQDNIDLSNKNKLAILDALIELMIRLDLSNTYKFIDFAIENLKKGDSSVKCMIMIEKILESCQKRGYPTTLKKTELISITIGAADIYLQNAKIKLDSYDELMEVDGAKEEEEPIEERVLIGNVTHTEAVNKFFHFIRFLLTKFDANNKLHNDNIEQMYSVFVEKCISKVEKHSFFKFFTYDEFDKTNSDLKRVANSKNREFLFKNILCKKLKTENTGTHEFKCFETNFFYINTMKKRLKRESNEQVFRTVSMDLEGLEFVWDFSINSPDHEIRTQCNNFIADLYLFNEKGTHVERGPNNTTFFESWLERILMIPIENKDATANILRLLFNFVRRYDGHHMDDKPFEKYDTDLEIEMHEPPKGKSASQIMKVNKEMTIGAIRKRIGDIYGIIPSEILIVSSRNYLTETCMNDELSMYRDHKKINVRVRTSEEKAKELPRYLAAENLKLVSQVIDRGLKSDNHALRCESLQFFEYIPANTERRDKMIECKKLPKNPDEESWLNFLYCESLKSQSLYYGLKVMKSIIEPDEMYKPHKGLAEFKSRKQNFYKKFIEKNGFHLLSHTINRSEIKKILEDVVWLSIFQLLTSILEFMLTDIDFISVIPEENKEDIITSTGVLIHQGSEILSIISENTSTNRDLGELLFTPEEAKTISEDKVSNIKHEYETLETEFYYQVIHLLKSCLTYNQNDLNVFYNSGFCKDTQVVNLIVFHPNKKTMIAVSSSLFDLISTFKEIENIDMNPVYVFIKLFTNKLGDILKLDTMHHTEFFNLFDRVLRLSNVSNLEKETFDSLSVAKMLYKTISDRGVVEDDKVQDTILSGSLILLTTLDEFFHDTIKSGCPELYNDNFLHFVLFDGLFSRRKPIKDNDDISYPLCKHSITRKSALKLLDQLFASTHLLEIAKFLEPYIKTGSWRTNKREKWYIQSAELQKRSTYVGLVNLGCTCYMNSLMQQLFMCPQFRNFIFTAEDQMYDLASLDDNVLYQSKYLFANLVKNKTPVYNPIVFFNSIKDFNGEPMPVNEQRDVDEFLNIYMDKVEKHITDPESEDRKHLKNIFGGEFVQECICIDCPHRSSRRDPFMAVSLEIKNKSTINEALDLYIQGEMLEGDNAYYCDRCEKKINALKRTCIKTLPNVLVLGLKRFEFDLETLSRYKLNSYLEFGDDLNMKDYCHETLEKIELKKKMETENMTYDMLSDDEKATYDFILPDIYYKYKLKGVVVHFGTSDGGHYYSYIKDRASNKWYDFNDTHVSEYDPANLPEDTFGGKLKHEQKVYHGGKSFIQTEKLHSAYILIYERQEFIENDRLLELQKSERVKGSQNVSIYKLQERQERIEPQIMKELTMYLDKHWLANKMFDERFIETVVEMCINHCKYLQKGTERSLDQNMDVDMSDEELYKLKFATVFTLGVVLRSEHRLRLASKIFPLIREAIKTNIDFASWIATCFSEKHTINEFCASNWSTQAGRIVAGLVKEAVKKTYDCHKEEIDKIILTCHRDSEDKPNLMVQNFINIMVTNMKDAPVALRCIYNFLIITMAKVNSNEVLNMTNFLYFCIMDGFANLGPEIRRLMIAFNIHRLCVSLAFSSNSSLQVLIPDVEIPESEFELTCPEFEVKDLDKLAISDFDENNLGYFKVVKLSKLDAIMIQNLGKDVEPFLYEFKLISKLMRSCQVTGPNLPAYDSSPYKMDNDEPLGIIDSDEITNLTVPSENVQGVLFGIRCANRPLRNELAKMYSHLLFNDSRSIDFCSTLVECMGAEEYNCIDQYERILMTVMCMPDSLLETRINSTLNTALKKLENNSGNYAYGDMFTSIFLKHAKQNKEFREMFYQNKIVDKIHKWLGMYSTPPIQNLRSNHSVFKNQKHNNRGSYEVISAGVDTIKSFNSKRKKQMKEMHTNMEKYVTSEPESEDDLYEEELEVGTKVDYLSGKLSRCNWSKGIVVTNMGEIVKVKKEENDMDVDGIRTVSSETWLNKDDNELVKADSKTKSSKATVLSLYNRAYYS